MIGLEFEVWVCPSCKGCTALPSTEGRDLTVEMNLNLKKDDVTISRATCQICGVERKRYIAKVIRSWELPRPQMSESEYFAYMEEQRRRAGNSQQDVQVRGSTPAPES